GGALDVGVDGLLAFHQLQLVVLQHRLPTRQGLQFPFQIGELLGRDRAGLHEFAVPFGTRPHRLDLAFLFADLAFEVRRRRLRGHQRVPTLPQSLLGHGDLGEFGQVATTMCYPSQLGVDLGEVEQLALHGGFCLHYFLRSFSRSQALRTTTGYSRPSPDIAVARSTAESAVSPDPPTAVDSLRARFGPTHHHDPPNSGHCAIIGYHAHDEEPDEHPANP